MRGADTLQARRMGDEEVDHDPSAPVLMPPSRVLDSALIRPAVASTRPRADEPAVEVALLDGKGVITSVNDAWTDFALANGGDLERSGVGVSYLEACDATDDPTARAVADAIRGAIHGDLPAPMVVDVACHAPGTSRWFDVLISSRFDDDGRCGGAAVTLSLRTSRSTPVPTRGAVRAPAAGDEGDAVAAFYADRSERMGEGFAQLLFERAPLGILVVDDHGVVVRASRAAERLFGLERDDLTGAPVHRVLPGLDLSVGVVAPATDLSVGAGHGVRCTGVLADGSPVALEVRTGPVALSRGSGLVVLVGSPHDPLRDVGDGTGATAMPAITDDLDMVVRDLFECGMSIASIQSAYRSDLPLVELLHRLADQLDQVVRDIRSTSMGLHHDGPPRWDERP